MGNVAIFKNLIIMIINMAFCLYETVLFLQDIYHSWNAPDPVFDSCFEDIVFTIVPCIVFWILGLTEIPVIIKKKRPPVVHSKLMNAKMVRKLNEIVGWIESVRILFNVCEIRNNNFRLDQFWLSINFIIDWIYLHWGTIWSVKWTDWMHHKKRCYHNLR